jgi:hypothetical protein
VTKPEMALVTDVRFPNEVDAIHAHWWLRGESGADHAA